LSSTVGIKLNKFDKTVEATQKELTGTQRQAARYYLALALIASGWLFEAIQELESLLPDDPLCNHSIVRSADFECSRIALDLLLNFTSGIENHYPPWKPSQGFIPLQWG
jgi:hypothetical protein